MSIVAAALFAAVATTSPAQAEQRSMYVSYADLDLTTSEGEAELDQRIRRAAWDVCRAVRDGSLRDKVGELRCVRAARQQSAVEVANVMRDVRLGG